MEKEERYRWTEDESTEKLISLAKAHVYTDPYVAPVTELVLRLLSNLEEKPGVSYWCNAFHRIHKGVHGLHNGPCDSCIELTPDLEEYVIGFVEHSRKTQTSPHNSELRIVEDSDQHIYDPKGVICNGMLAFIQVSKEPLQYQSDEKLPPILQELLNASEPYLDLQKGTKSSDCKKLNMAYEKARQALKEFEDQKTRKKETNEH